MTATARLPHQLTDGDAGLSGNLQQQMDSLDADIRRYLTDDSDCADQACDADSG